MPDILNIKSGEDWYAIQSITGPQGAAGVSITSVTKVSTAGLVDTYRIDFSNSTSTTFTITNGEDGAKGDTGDAAGFGTPTATASSLPTGSAPTASVTASGSATAKVFAFNFGIPTGATGATGNGISSIAKTGTVGLVDTYTVTFTNGTTTTFTVTNGTSELESTTGQSTVKGMTQKAITDELTELNEDKAQKTELAKTDRSLKYLWELTKGQSWSTTAGTTPVYADAVPQGSHMADVGMIGGKSAVWNQIADFPNNGNLSCSADVNATFIRDFANHKMTATSKVSSSVSLAIGSANDSTILPLATYGHKFYAKVKVLEILGGVNPTQIAFNIHRTDALNVQSWHGVGDYEFIVDEANVTQQTWIWANFPSYTANSTGWAIDDRVQVIDLTLLGMSDITSLTDPRIAFIKEYALLHPAYNAGTIIDAKTDKVKSVGANVWDEQWEIGSISWSGVKESGNNLRSKNLIPVDSNTAYYFKCPAIWLFEYSANGAFLRLGNNGSSISNNSCTIGNDTKFVMFKTYASRTTYSDEIQICLNTYAEKTTYHPYVAHNYPIPSSVQALEGYGWSAGSVYNYVDFVNKKFHKRVGSVDLGSLTWVASSTSNCFYANVTSSVQYKCVVQNVVNMVCGKYQYAGAVSDVPYYGNDKTIRSYGIIGANKELYVHDSAYSDAAAFKAAMNGVMLYYELATPQVYDVTDLFTDDVIISTEAGGTLTFHQQNDVKLPIPNTTTHYINLSEVTSNG